MEKVNFAKIEEALRRALDKLHQEKLLGMTPSKRLENTVKKRLNTLIFLKTWIKRIPKVEEYRGIIKRIRELDTNYTEEEWVQLEALKDKMLAKMSTGIKKPPTDEQIIDLEKHQHEQKRFNIPERWLPLD